MTADAPDRVVQDHATARADVVAAWTAASRVAMPRLGRLTFKQWIIATALVVIAVVDMTRGFSLIVTSVSTMQNGPEQTSTRRVVGETRQPVQQPARAASITSTSMKTKTQGK